MTFHSDNYDYGFDPSSIKSFLADRCGIDLDIQESTYKTAIESKVEISEFEKAPDDRMNSTGRWPWGNHQTKLLEHLEAAAREFWTCYDSQNAKATAPKNETVVAWLKERKVSKLMANSIATMLRPDDLPTGPRK